MTIGFPAPVGPDGWDGAQPLHFLSASEMLYLPFQNTSYILHPSLEANRLEIYLTLFHAFMLNKL